MYIFGFAEIPTVLYHLAASSSWTGSSLASWTHPLICRFQCGRLLCFHFLTPLVIGVPTQLGKAEPTAYNTDLHMTSYADPLPELPTANIDRSSLTIKDGGVLVHYISSNVDFATSTQAIIVIHGKERDAANSFAGMQAAIEAANKSKITIIAVRSPFFILKITKLMSPYSPFSSMGTIRARFLGRTAQPLPINSCGKVGMSVWHRNEYLTHFP